MKKITLRGIGAIGVLLFTPIFIFTFSDPQLIETSGKLFIEHKLEQETNKKIDSIRLPEKKEFEKLLGEKASTLRVETEQKLDAIRNQLKKNSPEILADQIAKMRNLDCECRKKWEQNIRSSMHIQIASLEAAKLKLIEFSQTKYMEIVQKLTLDVRVFLGVNSIIFIFLFIISFLKPLAINHLFLPSSLMFISTIICSYFYLFEQNWFYTIIYNDYTGYGYISYLMIVFAFLCDIVFNSAKVTTEIINTLLDAIGSATTLAPC